MALVLWMMPSLLVGNKNGRQMWCKMEGNKVSEKIIETKIT